MRENWYIGFIFLGDDVVVHITVMLLRLFVELSISFAVLVYYSLVGMHLNSGVSFETTFQIEEKFN